MCITPVLSKYADVDVLISGNQTDLKLPFEIKYQKRGAGFYFGKKGGIDIFKTILQQNPVKFIRDISQLPIDNYDLVISDFEPITAWACKLRGKRCVAMSHQAAFKSQNTPRPINQSLPAEFVLKQYAPTSDWIGFHFEKYDDGIYEPIIRKGIRRLQCRSGSHYTVYLPAFSQSYLEDIFSMLPEVEWRIYIKGLQEVRRVGHMHFIPVGESSWLTDVANAAGVIIGAGFEGPSEMLHLGKKMLVIPMVGQYEQICNAVALEEMGVKTLPHLKKDSVPAVSAWLEGSHVVQRRYENEVEHMVENLLGRYEDVAYRCEPSSLSSIS